MDEKKLTALFEQLGASDAADWARAQAREGIPQLARFLFLRQAWRNVLRPSDTGWIDEALKLEPSGPGGGIVRSLKNAEAAGVTREDLTEIVRVKQWELLFQFCYLLDDPQIEEADARGISWGLFQIGEDDLPGRQINGLYESVLETDPTGREMRST
jgi:hypothetical protein